MTQWGLDTLFNPAKRHMDEEKRRLQATRQQVGDTSGGKRIDLESGKVRIGKAAVKDDESDESDEEMSTSAEQPADGATTGAEVADGEQPAGSDMAPKKRAATKPTAKEPTAKKSAAKKSAAKKSEPSAAAIRAAQRRGRQPR
jgi:hypothetical protein